MIRITQKEIARKLGVSSQTVRFALSNDGEKQRQIRPETRKRILEAVKRVGYVPDRAGRRLALARGDGQGTTFDQVGLIYLSSTGFNLDMASLQMMSGAEHELARLHASLTFVRVNESSDWDKVERLVRAGGVDGWMLAGTVDDGAVNRLKTWRQPFIILGDHRSTQSVHSVNIDHFAVGRMAAEHLASLGHRRIGFIGGSLRFVYQQETLAGFKSAARELGLEEDEQLFIRAVLRTRKGLDEVREWIPKLHPKPTAFFTAEPETANPILGVLRELHFEVPQSISLIASEDRTSERLDMEYTRIELPITDLGSQGALLLHKLVSDARVASREIKLSPSIIQGWSSCPPQGRGGSAQPTSQRKK